MLNTKIEKLRNALHSKIQAGIIINAETLEMSRKLDVAINEYYASVKIEKESYKRHIS